jgi:hypothetical protein
MDILIKFCELIWVLAVSCYASSICYSNFNGLGSYNDWFGSYGICYF